MRRIRKLALFAAILLMFLSVSCDLNPKVQTATEVSFLASVSKSLNESASTEITTVTDVNQYYWLYYAGPEAPGEASQFTAFKDLLDINGKQYSKGLGRIENLVRGDNYVFALRGYSSVIINNSGAVETTETDLRWYGVSSTLKLNSSRMHISLAVAPAGQGSVQFDFKALGVNGTTSDCDLFEISISSIETDKTLTLTEHGVAAGSVIYYKSDLIALDSGCYFVTVQQKYDNGDDVNSRAQVLLIQVEAGVTTKITGSLDSTAKEART